MLNVEFKRNSDPIDDAELYRLVVAHGNRRQKCI